MQQNPNHIKLYFSKNLIKKTRLKYPNANEEINNTNEDSIEIELKPFENKNLYIIESKITGIAIKKAY